MAASASAASRAAFVSFLLVTIGSCVGGHLRFLVGVPVTIAGVLAACVAARRVREPYAERPVDAICVLLSAMAAIGLASPSPQGSISYEILYRFLPASGLVAVGVLAAGSAAWRRRAVWFTVCVAVLLAVLAPAAVRNPHIDVWDWMQACGSALLHGIHPYSVRVADETAGALDFGSTPTIMPYMPLVIAAAAPWIAVLGDCRFELAACLPITIALLRAAGRRLRVDTWMIDAVTLAWVLHPRGTLMVIKSYQEPLLVAVLALFVYLSAGDEDGYGAASAFFLLPALKQYVVAPVVIYAAMRRRRPSAVVVGAAVAAATVLPFLIWNAQATVDGMLYLMRAPIGFRADSDSLAAFVAQVFDVHAGRSLAVVAQLAAGAAAWAALRRQGLGGLLLASALSLLASFLVATQAFFNYYYFAGALLLCAALVFARPAAERAPAA